MSPQLNHLYKNKAKLKNNLLTINNIGKQYTKSHQSNKI